MNLDELAKYEIELYDKVCLLEGSMKEKDNRIHELGIYDQYRRIHQGYANLSKEDLEALKRGLFLIWYSMSEPSCFTGIKELDSEAEEKIIKTLNRRLKRDITDYELDWMLAYYSNWDNVFEHFSDYTEFHKKLKSELKVEMPKMIDRKQMNNRGQMGVYWNSLAKFNMESSN